MRRRVAASLRPQVRAGVRADRPERVPRAPRPAPAVALPPRAQGAPPVEGAECLCHGERSHLELPFSKEIRTASAAFAVFGPTLAAQF